jgi:hypothetical protein
MRSENRALLIASIARGRRWLNELIADPTANTTNIATRDGCSVRKVNMTISLAFLAPDVSRAEKKAPIGRQNHRSAVSETKWSYKNPAKSGHLARLQEISTIARVRGGGCSPIRTRLSLQFREMQGDFDKMQGRGKRSPAKNCQMS